MFKIFLVLVKILRKSMHQFSISEEVLERGHWKKLEIFWSVIFLNAKTFEKFAKFSNHKTEINNKKLLINYKYFLKDRVEIIKNRYCYYRTWNPTDWL